MQRQPVRWWVVALAIILSWALTCFGPTAEVEAQSLVADSGTLRRLVKYHNETDGSTAVCIHARWLAEDIYADSITGIVAGPPCPEGTNGIIGSVGEDVDSVLSKRFTRLLLADQPSWLVVCLIVGLTEDVYPGMIIIETPLMRCAYRVKKEDQ